MKKDDNIQKKVERTLGILEAVNEVKPPPFFKERTMQRIFVVEEAPTNWSWFSPKLQLATLLCVVVLNIWALIQLKSDSYESNVNEFAESFGLITDTDTESSFFE